eukprot:TRINITY_DN7459_c0_g1_i1.p1 TRINITY_DN7459_c0_g1~~TRINITY_DN7459_c0_g1_i1.p1  ORF type:complete len:472 (+),score=108.33 TRINITY_DN7459_c0_g1_i1:56-1471(+)
MESLQVNTAIGRVSARREQEKRLQALLSAGLDINVYGSKGIGKSYTVREVLSAVGHPFIEVSCFIYSSKGGLMKGIAHELNSKYDLNLDETASFYSFQTSMKKLLNAQESKKPPEGKVPEKLQELLGNLTYIVIDDFQLYEGGAKLIKKLLNTGLPIRLLLIGTRPLDLIIRDSDYLFTETLPRVRLLPHSIGDILEMLSTFLSTVIQPALSPQEQLILKKLGYDLVRDIFQSIGLLTTELERLKYLFELLVHFQLEAFKLAPKKYLDNPTLLLTAKTDNYNQALRLIAADPYATYASLDEVKLQLALTDKTAPQGVVDPSRLLPDLHIEMSKLGAMILLATYIGNRNPENTDKKVFKSASGPRSKRNRMVDETKNGRNVQKIGIGRLISLTDALLSLSEFEDEGFEFNSFDHTIDFYAEIALLESKGLLNRSSSQHDPFAKAKFLCNASYDFIRHLSAIHSIKLNEFLAE